MSERPPPTATPGAATTTTTAACSDPPPPPRLFLLSPARCSGLRAEQLLLPHASSDIARRLRASRATIGEVFAYLSALYFRGKLAYARTFARPPRSLGPAGGALAITPSAGLVPVDTLIGPEELRAFGRVDIAPENEAYLRPLEATARTIAERLGAPGPIDADVVLLGSVATAKYVEPLLAVFGERLLFPASFVGRGDMSRGGLCLRAARSGEELPYAKVAGAARHGPRPPKLPRPSRAG